MVSMINIDTTKMRKCGQDMIKISQDLDQTMNNLYSRIYNMSNVTREWVGGASELFAKQANDVEKKYAIELNRTIKQFGEVLYDCADKYDSEIRKNA